MATSAINPKMSAEKTIICHIMGQDEKHQTVDFAIVLHF